MRKVDEYGTEIIGSGNRAERKEDIKHFIAEAIENHHLTQIEGVF